jgi:tRNA(Arg) A34 adenosine deaminase TadA
MSYFISVAITEAKKSKMLHKHGCVIVCKNKIMAKGHNYMFNKHISIHAEIDAIKKMHTTDFAGCTMYVIRISNTNTLKLSKPCSHCAVTINALGIRRVYYSID